MNAELTALLYERYPAIFAQRHLPMIQSSMWMGFSCRDGWFELIADLCSKLQAGVDRGAFPQIECVQAKEKYGELRFYMNRGSDDAAQRLVDEASDRSMTICEICGQPGGLRYLNYWFRTRCDFHADPGSVACCRPSHPVPDPISIVEVQSAA